MLMQHLISLKLGLCILLLVTTAADASSIRRTSLTAMLAGSELIVQARVVALREDVSEARAGKVYTLVSLEVEDAIKGRVAPGERIELRYLGGVVKGRRMVVSDMSIPPLGERGVYFIKTREPRFIHPLSGWGQGHFLVVNDKPGGGTPRVQTAAGDTVYGLSEAGASHTLPALSHGVAAGVLTAPGVVGAPAMTLDAFKAGLKAYLGDMQ